MKALLILMIIYINYQVSAKEEKYQVKVYPKKVKPGNIRLINAGKYRKSQPVKLEQVTKKQTSSVTGYTAFPLVTAGGNKDPLSTNGQDVPYFAEESVQVNSRVKKVLPDYVWSIRRKRSAVPEDKKINKAPQANGSPVIATNINKATGTAAVKPTNKGGSVSTAKIKPKNDTIAKLLLRSGRKAKPKPKISARTKPKRTNNQGKMAKTTRKSAVKKNKRVVRSKKGVAGKPKGAARLASKVKTKVGGKAAKGPSRRLIASRDAIIEDYPYVVSIQKNNEHWCAGALLNPRLVITTANCMWKANRMTRMEVRAGSRHVDRGGQLANIAEVMKHPGWGIRKDPDYDLALILLDRNLRFSDKIHGVDLPNRVMMPAFDDAWITSWGADRRDGVYSPAETSLQVYHARLMDRRKCNNITRRFGVTVTENFVCLAQTGKRAPCTRDTGAPAVSDGVLWGLASWGIRKLCGTERFPAMFSYIASQSNMDFIMNATHYLMADERHYPYQDRYPFRAVLNTADGTPV